MTQMSRMQKLKNKIQTAGTIEKIIVTVLILAVLWFGLDAFFGLVSDLYHFLDGFIWAFFAGLLALWAAVVISAFIFYASIMSAIVLIAVLIGAAEWFGV